MKKELKCKYCGQDRHVVKKCVMYQLCFRQKTTKEFDQWCEENDNCKVLSIEGRMEADENSWCVDNDASSQVTNRTDLFESFVYFQNKHNVITAFGQTTNTIGNGTVNLDGDVNGRVKVLLLNDHSNFTKKFILHACCSRQATK